jgi:hypothetical protein
MQWIYRDLLSDTIPTYAWRDFCKSLKRLDYRPNNRDEARKQDLELLKQEF